ncbi:SEN34 subunit of tRNA-splicing endonuclease [Delitschia confertaspora ATCC 74209]|uniref:tRNA-splicing endonuclease subunit Sen34 n=1 Tax=Delitschia confertaspora ATCC 74209 TaxID=1513339 RepID=A0A9P4MRM3_9PLEO|nr:SEN34 subunit of tRNA-splicing endonuclease [Delitschia confertaspora ATCC 74209]
MAQDSSVEPFAISRIAERYLLFDVDVVTYVRREHNICGVLIGTIPHLSQQNIFLGIPLELMPEEARLLVEGGHAYIVEDVSAHKKGFLEMDRKDRLAFMQLMDQRGMELSLNAKRKAEDRSEKALQQRGLAQGKKENIVPKAPADEEVLKGKNDSPGFEDTSLFSLESSPAPQPPVSQQMPPHFVTPTTSHPPLTSFVPHTSSLPTVPRTYPLFKYLHSKRYFSTPGLRFGCHYTVYPGDPLRFHSHFLATGLDWDEEFDLLDIVGGGRLGTGVKKAYLVGGQNVRERTGEVRAFSIEWAGL